ncbi:c-type cytochrome [Nitrobacter sp. NHB1]|uniref:c-type cytochrome n=1 Tax=Nitrobacter sp. NHB1 TaxID=3119830 RepID=UPI0030007A22
MRSVVGAALLLLGMSALPALAADGKNTTTNVIPAGAASCSPCHGKQGEGQPATGVPRLAGLNAQYIQRQLASFKDGTRKNRIMMMIASELSDDDKKALANYYADMTTPKSGTSPADPALVAAGAKLAATGDWSKDLPGCGQCHGAAGLGVGTDFPRLAGQWAVYIEKALRSWKAGDRKNDPMGVMANVANKLTDDQIKSVAAYYESLPAPAPAKSQEAKP